MAWNFRKSFKIAPGLRVNLGKKGASLSIGPKGSKVTFGNNGTYVSGGIPGTGLYYREKVSGNGRKTSGGYKYLNEKSASNIIAVIGVISIIVCLYLFFSSFGWDWISHSHLRPRFRHNIVDLSWMKWLFYPFVILGFLFGVLCVREGMSSMKNIFSSDDISDINESQDYISNDSSSSTQNSKPDVQSEISRILRPYFDEKSSKEKDTKQSTKGQILKNATSAAKRSIVRDLTKNILGEFSPDNGDN